MRLLVLGGTEFVGRHLVGAALALGHEVTLFNRGRTNAALFPEAEKLRGDRDKGDVDALSGRTWDAVLDTTGYVPRWVSDSARALKGAVEQYLFVSTISVYDPIRFRGNDDEDAPLETLEDETTEDYSGPAYGGLKVLCERVVHDRFPGIIQILRPGVMFGPHDNTDRATYWTMRVARGGEVIAPGSSDRPLQLLDARDLAAFALAGVEAGRGGVYNTTGPLVTWGTFLEGCRAASGSDARFAWIDDEEFLECNTATVDKTFGALPLSAPSSLDNLFRIDSSRAIAQGLACRPMADTIRDMVAWRKTVRDDGSWLAGLAADEERELLRKWKTHMANG